MDDGQKDRWEEDDGDHGEDSDGIKEAKDVLGGQEEVLDQFRMTVHARRMEDDQHKTYCSLPLGVYACALACIDQTISSEHALRCLVSCQVN